MSYVPGKWSVPLCSDRPECWLRAEALEALAPRDKHPRPSTARVTGWFRRSGGETDIPWAASHRSSGFDSGRGAADLWPAFDGTDLWYYPGAVGKLLSGAEAHLLYVLCNPVFGIPPGFSDSRWYCPAWYRHWDDTQWRVGSAIQSANSTSWDQMSGFVALGPQWLSQVTCSPLIQCCYFDDVWVRPIVTEPPPSPVPFPVEEMAWYADQLKETEK